MKFNKAIVILAVAILLGWGMGATDDPVKIGMIDIEQAWSSTNEGKEVRNHLERMLRAAEAKMRPKIERFQQLQKEMQEMQHVLSKEALQTRQFDLVELNGQLENERAGLEQKFKIEQVRLLSPVQEKLQAVVEEIGRKGGFSLIIARAAPSIVYSREALDITDRVVEAFNDKKS